MTIGASLPHFAARKPDEPALVCDDEIVVWRDLHERIQAFAHDLDMRNPQGRTIALVARNAPSMIALFIACAWTGREAAILDPAWPQLRIAQALNDLAPALVYADEGGRLPNAISLAAAGGLRFPTQRPRSAVMPESSFYVGFTSGSTGRPKGYRRSHQSWLSSFAGDKLEFGLTEDDIILAPGSMTHSLFLYAAVHALHVGATLLMSQSFHPARALRLARDYRATIAYGAPTQWRMMIDAAKGSQLPCLRWVLSSGAKWFASASDDIARLAPNARFAEFYGASELSFVAVRKSGEPSPERSVGRPFANVAITIRDDEGRALPAGEAGRIFVQSPYLFSGYATGDQAIATLAGEMSVGDMGFLDAEGFLHLVGRQDRMIVSSGKNVFAEEIEEALASIPGVKAAAVFGIPDPLRGQKIVALLLPDGSRKPDRADLARGLRARLPLPFVPRLFAIPAQWRWTASGKTDFDALRKIYDAGDWEEAP